MLSLPRASLFCREWLAEDKARAIAAEKARIEEEEANMLVGPELPAGATQQDMGDYGGALLPGRLSFASVNVACTVFAGLSATILRSVCLFSMSQVNRVSSLY